MEIVKEAKQMEAKEAKERMRETNEGQAEDGYRFIFQQKGKRMKGGTEGVLNEWKDNGRH